MTTDENKAAVRRIYDTLNRAMRAGDLDLIDEVIGADAVDHGLPPAFGPGLQGIKRAFGELRSAFPDLQFTVEAEDMISEGDKVACLVRTQATHKGAFLGVAPTGKKVTQAGIDVLRIAGGKIVERWGQFDDLGLLKQLGVIAP